MGRANMKVLLLARKLERWEIKGGRYHSETFRTVLSGLCDLVYCEDFSTPAPELVNRFEADVLLLHFPNIALNKTLRGIDKVVIPKVHIMGDYTTEGRMSRYDPFLKRHKFDLVLEPCYRCMKALRSKGLAGRVELLPFSIDTSVCYDWGRPRTIDVIAMFSHDSRIYPRRNDVLDTIKTMSVSCFLRSRRPFRKYLEFANKARIFAHANAISNNVAVKYPEVMACGTLFVTDRPDELDLLGYRDRKHLVIYNTMEEMREKIEYYLAHNEEREQIAKAGAKFVRENFSHGAIAQRLINLMQELL